MSLIPISDKTLAYGSGDAASTIHTSNRDFYDKVTLVCQELGLKAHQVKEKSTDKVKTLSSPVDLEGHIGFDGRKYMLDFSRLFPPELPNKDVKASYLCRLLRPGFQLKKIFFFVLLFKQKFFKEFVKKYSQMKGPLSPDAFSNFAKESNDRTQNNKEIAEASEYLLREQIPLFSQRLLTFVSTDVWAFVDEMHRYGLNYRHFGAVINNTFSFNFNSTNSTFIFFLKKQRQENLSCNIITQFIG